MSAYGRAREDIVEPIRQLKRKVVELTRVEMKTPDELRRLSAQLREIAMKWDHLEARFKALNASDVDD